MTLLHNPGFPRIGAHRELKHALEAYWLGASSEHELEQAGIALRARHWRAQADKGLDLLPVGDFSWYDTVLDLSAALGAIPPRFGWSGDEVDLDTYFRMARGRGATGAAVAACEMTKWFDTNYHYIVPELQAGQSFRLSSRRLFQQVEEAQALGYRVKPTLPGPLTWLWLAKSHQAGFDKLSLLDALLPVYGELLQGLQALGVEWVQIDEPILALDLPPQWQQAFAQSYHRLCTRGLNKLVAVYFGPLQDNLSVACDLPVEGLHLDAVRGGDELPRVIDRLSPYQVLSIGIVDGRNVWRTDLDRALQYLQMAHQRLGERLWLAPSCSLQHVPVDLDDERQLDPGLRTWLAFAAQKLDELALLRQALDDGPDSVRAELQAAREAMAIRRATMRQNRDADAAHGIPDNALTQRISPYPQRAEAQRRALNLPPFPTTTIGSFPQTAEIRRARRDFHQGTLDEAAYRETIRAEIRRAIRAQETLGLDLLVHGEAERNDMVEYFGEHLAGFAVTRNGWVQSYGSRCVKPPLLYGDVGRPHAITLEWTRYAQSLTDKPVKGMLTGPVTLLNWSFVRDDQPRWQTCLQIAQALRQEVLDLEAAGINAIQIDEAALREGLPLRQADWQTYLDWAVTAFRVAAAGVADRTQIHTHMCYSEFNDIMAAIAAMDADVITIETSRSNMELLDLFQHFAYPNEIGPGVYDIHSPNVPRTEQMVALLKRAAQVIDPQRLWVNPDCGLKTRAWPEVEAALANMVQAAQQLRAERLPGASPPA